MKGRFDSVEKWDKLKNTVAGLKTFGCSPTDLRNKSRDYAEKACRRTPDFDIVGAIEKGALNSSPLLKHVVIACTERGLRMMRRGTEDEDDVNCRGRQFTCSEKDLEGIAVTSCELARETMPTVLRQLGLLTNLSEAQAEEILTRASGAGTIESFCLHLAKDFEKAGAQAADLLRMPCDGVGQVHVTVSMDETGLLRKILPTKRDGRFRGVGGAFHKDPTQNMADLDISDKRAENQDNTAPLLLETLIKRCDHWEPFPLSSLPLPHKGCSYENIAELVGELLDGLMSCPTTRVVSFAWDNHGAFAKTDDIFLGREALPKGEFWAKRVEQLEPASQHDDVGVLVVQHKCTGAWSVVYGSVDPGHLLKIFVRAARAKRLLWIGDMPTSFSGVLDEDCPPWVYVGRDIQSDREASLFLVFCAIAKDGPVPFYRLAALLYAFITSLILGAWKSRNMDIDTRHFFVSVAYYFLRMQKACTGLEMARAFMGSHGRAGPGWPG